MVAIVVTVAPGVPAIDQRILLGYVARDETGAPGNVQVAVQGLKSQVAVQALKSLAAVLGLKSQVAVLVTQSKLLVKLIPTKNQLILIRGLVQPRSL